MTIAKNELRIVPGYEEFSVTPNGVVFNSITLEILEPKKIWGRYFHFGKSNDLVSLHKLVALTWVKNPDPEKYNVVNHIDGNPLNNYYKNLEWTDTSGNNYHAVNTGLRDDPIPCRVRDFITGMVFKFPSTAQAAEFMGLSKDAHYEKLRPKMFGKLVNGQFEYRQDGDSEPWFYENRTEKIHPARFKVIVTKPDGAKEEIFSTRSLLKAYGLYYPPYGTSIPALAKYAGEKYPDHKFEVIDGYANRPERAKQRVKSIQTVVIATNGKEVTRFDSLTKCAKHFRVDRSLIKARLNNNGIFNGWKFHTEDSARLSSNG